MRPGLVLAGSQRLKSHETVPDAIGIDVRANRVIGRRGGNNGDEVPRVSGHAVVSNCDLVRGEVLRPVGLDGCRGITDGEGRRSHGYRRVIVVVVNAGLVRSWRHRIEAHGTVLLSAGEDV